MKTLFILNGPPYGTEHSYNGLRLAGALAKRDGEHVRIFLMGDAVGCALQGQVLPEGYYHLDRMLGSAIRRGAEVGCCGTCMGLPSCLRLDSLRRRQRLRLCSRTWLPSARRYARTETEPPAPEPEPEPVPALSGGDDSAGRTAPKRSM